ncbi:MAG: ribbon-helix-helix domain-containing protein, partial [Mycobacteriaceae bacterium]
VGRPREGTLVGVRVPDADLAALDEEAALEGVSRAQLIRAAIAARVSPTHAPEDVAALDERLKRLEELTGDHET